MYEMTPIPVESKLPVASANDVGGVRDGVGTTSTVGSPLRRPLAMTSSLPEASNRGGMEEDELDEEMAVLSKLRCTSLQTEEIAKIERDKKERQARRNNRYIKISYCSRI